MPNEIALLFYVSLQIFFYQYFIAVKLILFLTYAYEICIYSAADNACKFM